jgi:hypothetical protein
MNREGEMKAGYGELKAGSDAVSAALGAARSARNRASRERAADARETSASARRYKRTRAREDRERERAMNRRFRVQVADTDRPRMKGRTPHRLFYRLGGQAMGTRITASSSGGTRSIHFAVTARGFASRTGRAWRGGEGERAALYIVREDALEGGEAGWWSNVAADRNELAAFHRASEAFERHDRANANVYMSEVIALPDSLSAKQRRKAVRRYCQTFDRRGLGYTVAMHLPDSNGDGRNYHCHIVYSLRPVTRLGAYDWSLAVSKVADVNTPDGIRARRDLAVAAINATLKASGSAQRYTDASNRARGLGAPSPKQGQKQTWALRRAAVVEARSAALARLQAATSALRAGLAILARAETPRSDIRSRLRGMQEDNTAALADSDQRLAAVRIRVQDGLFGERIFEAAADPAGRITVAKSNVVDILAGAMAGFTSPDAFAARIAAVADARTRRKARRQVDAEALTAAADKLAAAPPPDLEPYRTVVVARLSESSTELLRLLPDLTPTRSAVYDRLGVEAARIGATYDADRQRIIDLAPVRRPDDRKPVDPEAGRKSVPAAPKPAARTAPDLRPSIKAELPTEAVVSEDMASRAANTPFTLPAPSNGTAGDDPALIAANREDEARRRRIATARETARIRDILERAFARLAAPGVRIRLADNGGYQLPTGLLDAEERAALQHADHHTEIRARLANLYAAQRTVAARGAAPGSDAAPLPDASLAAPTLAPAATSAPVPIPLASHDEDLAILQAAKDRQDAKKGR